MSSDFKSFVKGLQREPKKVPVVVPGYDKPLFVREFTVAEAENIVKTLTGTSHHSSTVLMIVYGLVDDDGQNVFKKSEIEDVEKLNNTDIFEDVINKAMEFINNPNGINKDDIDTDDKEEPTVKN